MFDCFKFYVDIYLLQLQKWVVVKNEGSWEVLKKKNQNKVLYVEFLHFSCKYKKTHELNLMFMIEEKCEVKIISPMKLSV